MGWRARHPWLGLGLLLLLAGLLTPAIDFDARPVTPSGNANVAEAAAWRDGHLDLRVTAADVAVLQGRQFNVFPPLWTLVSYGVLALSPQGVPRWVFTALLLWPAVLLTYALSWWLTGRVLPAVAWSLAVLFGTSYLPVLLAAARHGFVWQTNHSLAQIGLLVFLLDYFGARRIWLAACGLLIAAWSRPLTGLYIVALGWMVWQVPAAVRSRRLAAALPIVVLTLTVPLILNALKFGSPFETGYAYMYVGRADFLALRAAQGLFGLHFVPDNLTHFFLGFPVAARGASGVRHDPFGAGVWWTTPLLLWLAIAARAWWRDRDRRVLMAPVAAILTAHLLYHNTGWLQPGYNRFSLDYLVVLLAVIAPFAFMGKRCWLSLALIGWSVWYFRWISE